MVSEVAKIVKISKIVDVMYTLKTDAFVWGLK